MPNSTEPNDAERASKLDQPLPVSRNHVQPYSGNVRVWKHEVKDLWFAQDMDSKLHLFGDTRNEALDRLDKTIEYLSQEINKGGKHLNLSEAGSPITFQVGEIVSGRKVSWINQRPDGIKMFGMPYDSGFYLLIEVENEDNPSANIMNLCVERKQVGYSERKMGQ